jgi:hypothetical protein
MARKPGPTRPAPKPQPIAKLDNFYKKGESNSHHEIKTSKRERESK